MSNKAGLHDLIDEAALYARIDGEYFMVEVPRKTLIEIMSDIQGMSDKGRLKMVHLPSGLDEDSFGEIPKFH